MTLYLRVLWEDLRISSLSCNCGWLCVLAFSRKFCGLHLWTVVGSRQSEVRCFPRRAPSGDGVVPSRRSPGRWAFLLAGGSMVSLSAYLAAALSKWAHHMPGSLLGSGADAGMGVTVPWSCPRNLAVVQERPLPSAPEHWLARCAALTPPVLFSA